MGFNWTFYDHVINLDVDERCISREKSRNVGTGWILKFIAKGRRRGGKKKKKRKWFVVPLIQHDDMFFSSVQITINAHASVSYMLAALGINVVPTMPMIYLVFASLVCMTFVSVPFLPPAKMKWNRMPIFGALLKKFSVHGIVEKCTLTSCPCCFSPLTRSQPE